MGCGECSGSGACDACSGYGTILDPGDLTDGQDCPVCEGDGTCPDCAGTGEITTSTGDGTLAEVSG